MYPYGYAIKNFSKGQNMFEIPPCDFDIHDEHAERVVYDKKLNDRYYDMIKRCYNTEHKSYARYGGRGITVCDKWREDRFTFLEWSIENGYKSTLEIDRIDNSIGYSPDNCRYITRSENQKNKG